MTTSSTVMTGTDRVTQKLNNWDLTTKLLSLTAAVCGVSAAALAPASLWFAAVLAVTALGTGTAAVTLRWVLNSIGGLRLMVDDPHLREMVRREARHEIAATR